MDDHSQRGARDLARAAAFSRLMRSWRPAPAPAPAPLAPDATSPPRRRPRQPPRAASPPAAVPPVAARVVGPTLSDVLRAPGDVASAPAGVVVVARTPRAAGGPVSARAAVAATASVRSLSAGRATRALGSSRPQPRPRATAASPPRDRDARNASAELRDELLRLSSLVSCRGCYTGDGGGSGRGRERERGGFAESVDRARELERLHGAAAESILRLARRAFAEAPACPSSMGYGPQIRALTHELATLAAKAGLTVPGAHAGTRTSGAAAAAPRPRRPGEAKEHRGARVGSGAASRVRQDLRELKSEELQEYVLRRILSGKRANASAGPAPEQRSPRDHRHLEENVGPMRPGREEEDEEELVTVEDLEGEISNGARVVRNIDALTELLVEGLLDDTLVFLSQNDRGLPVVSDEDVGAEGEGESEELYSECRVPEIRADTAQRLQEHARVFEEWTRSEWLYRYGARDPQAFTASLANDLMEELLGELSCEVAGTASDYVDSLVEAEFASPSV
eukprot:m51a1_g6043 hypothetical protein (511) ;mRNA; r:175723-178401